MYCKLDGMLRKNESKGRPQGGVISPVLANIFMDIVFDKWMAKHYPDAPFERYADDVVIHSNDFKEALRLLEQIKARLKQCKLEAHRDKTKIVYCKRDQKIHPPFELQYRTFDFLGFTFKTRRTRAKWGRLQLVYTPTMSKKAYKRVGENLRKLRLHRMVHLQIQQSGIETSDAPFEFAVAKMGDKQVSKFQAQTKEVGVGLAQKSV